MKIDFVHNRGFHNLMLTPAVWYGKSGALSWLGIQWLRSSWLLRFDKAKR